MGALKEGKETKSSGASTVGDDEYMNFLEDLEEDADIRKNVNVYKDNKKVVVDDTDKEDDEVPKISLAEMLDELEIKDTDMAE